MRATQRVRVKGFFGRPNACASKTSSREERKRGGGRRKVEIAHVGIRAGLPARTKPPPKDSYHFPPPMAASSATARCTIAAGRHAAVASAAVASPSHGARTDDRNCPSFPSPPAGDAELDVNLAAPCGRSLPAQRNVQPPATLLLAPPSSFARALPHCLLSRPPHARAPTLAMDGSYVRRCPLGLPRLPPPCASEIVPPSRGPCSPQPLGAGLRPWHRPDGQARVRCGGRGRPGLRVGHLQGTRRRSGSRCAAVLCGRDPFFFHRRSPDRPNTSSLLARRPWHPRAPRSS